MSLLFIKARRGEFHTSWNDISAISAAEKRHVFISAACFILRTRGMRDYTVLSIYINLGHRTSGGGGNKPGAFSLGVTRASQYLIPAPPVSIFCCNTLPLQLLSHYFALMAKADIHWFYYEQLRAAVWKTFTQRSRKWICWEQWDSGARSCIKLLAWGFCLTSMKSLKCLGRYSLSCVIISGEHVLCMTWTGRRLSKCLAPSLIGSTLKSRHRSRLHARFLPRKNGIPSDIMSQQKTSVIYVNQGFFWIGLARAPTTTRAWPHAGCCEVFCSEAIE